MDHDKFCTAAQAWSTPVWGEDFVLLRRAYRPKQEEDHVIGFRAMALREAAGAALASRINRLMVKTGKSGAAAGFGYGAEYDAAEAFS
jgi:hypothetical protein